MLMQGFSRFFLQFFAHALYYFVPWTVQDQHNYRCVASRKRRSSVKWKWTIFCPKVHINWWVLRRFFFSRDGNKLGRLMHAINNIVSSVVRIIAKWFSKPVKTFAKCGNFPFPVAITSPNMSWRQSRQQIPETRKQTNSSIKHWIGTWKHELRSKWSANECRKSSCDGAHDVRFMILSFIPVANAIEDDTTASMIETTFASHRDAIWSSLRAKWLRLQQLQPPTNGVNIYWITHDKPEVSKIIRIKF